MTTFSKITIPLTLCLLISAVLGQAQENQPAKEAEKPEMPAFPIMRLDADGPVSRVTSLVFSPDGKTLYAAGLDKAVYAWTKDAQGKFQFASDKMLRIPIGPDTSGTINAMALSADGKYLAVGGKAVGRRFTGFKEGGLIFPSSTQSLEDRLDTGTIFVFDLSQPGPPKVMHLRGHLGIVTLLDFANAAGQTPVLVSAGEEYDPATGDQRGAVRVWDLANPKESIAEKFDLLAPSDDKNAQDKPKNLPRGIAALRTAGKQPTNVLVGIAWADNVLRVWDVANKKTVELPNQLSVACTNVGNNFLLAGGFRNGWKLGLWKPPVNGNASPTEGTPLSAGTAPIGLASASDAPLALVVSLNLQSRKVGFFLADSRNLTRQPANAADTLFGDNTVSPAYAISPAGDLVAVAGNLDKKIQIYRVNRNQAPALFQQLEGQGDLLPLVRFYRNGDSLGLGLNQNVQAGNAAADLIFDLTAGANVLDNAKANWKPAPANVNITAKLGTQANRKTVVIDQGGGKTATIILPENQVVNETAPAQIAICPKTENHPPLVGLIVKTLFGESILRVYNAETGDRLRQFSGHTDVISSIAFSDDGKLMASAGEDRTVRVWWMEDLKTHIGRHGFFDKLLLSDINGKPTVKEIDEFAAADIKAALKVGDVLEGFTPADGKFQPAKKASSFFYYLSQIPVLSENDGKPNAVSLQIVRNGNPLPNPPKVLVQQGVDERKPLFTLFFKNGQAGRAWIGWTPLGPFDSNDKAIEELVGWHFNPTNADAPASYATLAEYNKDFHTKDLFKTLIATGELPKDKDEEEEEDGVADPPVGPTAPPPPRAIRMSVSIYERPGPDQDPVRLDADEQQKIHARTKNLTASFSLSGISSTEVEGNLTWLVDGKKQAFYVTEPIRGVFDADLSKFDWQDNQSYTLRVSFHDETNGQEHFIEQAIAYAEPPKPTPPPKPKKLPQAAIVSPDLLTVLYDQLQKPEIPIVVNLRAADEDPVEPGQLTFEINGKPVEKAGEALVHEFDDTLKAVKDTLPLVNGENVIRARLKAADGRPDKLTESVVVYYRLPPRVTTVTAKADLQFPRAEITCEFQTPEDRPPVDYQIFVNSKLFSVDKDQTTATQDKTDKTKWTVTAKDVPLSEGPNLILFYPRNTDARSLSTIKVDQPWKKPAPKAVALPSRPEIYFANADDQIPIAGHWRGDDFRVAFNVLAGGKLKKLFVYYNKKRLDAPAIPQPKDGSKYEFQLPVKLSRKLNELRVVAMDENNQWTEVPIRLAPLKPPVTIVIDKLEVPAANVSIIPQESDEGDVTFGEALPDARVILHGRVITSDSTKRFERPWVKCWVNGYLQWGLATLNPEKPTEWDFAMNLTLNEEKQNSLHLDLPEAPRSQISHTHCYVDCLEPEKGQNLHVVLVGIDPTTLESVDTQALKKQAAKAFNGNGSFEKPPKYYALETPIRAARITELLEQIKGEAKFKAERGGHDVVVFYYQGAEMLNQRDEIVLRTQDQVKDRAALTNLELKELLSDMYGAHLLLLDVTQPAAITKDWNSGEFLGMLRNIHDKPMPVNGFPLISALETALPKTRELKELPNELKQSVKKLDNSVPADLERVNIGGKR